MATKQGVVTELHQGFVRGEVSIGVSEAEILKARMVFAYAQRYYPKEAALFVAGIGGVPQSLEDERYLRALIRFTTELFERHADDEMLQSVSPKEMVEKISEKLVEDAKLRRAHVRRRANELVKKYVRDAPSEQRALEDKLVEAIRVSIDTSQTPQQLRAAIEREMATLPLPSREVTHDLLDESPLSAQRLLFADPTREARVLEQIPTLPAPAWRAYVAAVESLQMKPDETVDALVSRAKDVGLVDAFLSSDVSRGPAARANPGALVAAILEASGNKTAVKAFEQLTQQAKNAVSLITIANAWEKTVDVITRRAGGAIAQSIEPMIRDANKQSLGGSTKQAASLVGDIMSPILGRTFERLTELDALNLASPDKTKATMSSPQTLLLLAAYTWKPEGVTFEQRRVEGSLEPVGWVVRWAADSAFGKVVDRAVKSEAARGFFGKIIQPVLGFFGIRVGGAATKAVAGRGLSAVLGSFFSGVVAPGVGHVVGFIGGFLVIPVLKKVGGWISNLVTGRVGQLGAVIGALEQATGVWSGARAPSKPKQWYEQDWVPIALIVAAAVLIPMFGAMMQLATTDSALFVASVLPTGGPYTETFPEYNGPFPLGPTTVSTCAVDHKNLTQKPFDSGGIGTHKNTCAYDFNAPWMSPVVATHDGCVAFVRTDRENNRKDEGSYGNVVILAGKNPDGSVFYSRYAHLAQNTSSHLSKGQCISAGSPVGNVDNTGNSTGTHLHLEFLNENMEYVTQNRCFSAYSLPGCTQ